MDVLNWIRYQIYYALISIVLAQMIALGCTEVFGFNMSKCGEEMKGSYFGKHWKCWKALIIFMFREVKHKAVLDTKQNVLEENAVKHTQTERLYSNLCCNDRGTKEVKPFLILALHLESYRSSPLKGRGWES